jgi:hypothetical protein
MKLCRNASSKKIISFAEVSFCTKKLSHIGRPLISFRILFDGAFLYGSGMYSDICHGGELTLP